MATFTQLRDLNAFTGFVPNAQIHGVFRDRYAAGIPLGDSATHHLRRVRLTSHEESHRVMTESLCEQEGKRRDGSGMANGYEANGRRDVSHRRKHIMERESGPLPDTELPHKENANR